MAWFKSIKSKIMIFAILATLIPSLGLGLLSFRQNEAQISDNVARELGALTSEANREIELWLDKRVHEVHVTSTSGAVIDGLSAIARPQARTQPNTVSKHPQALAQYLRSVQEKLDTIRELTVVNAAGKVVASSAQTAAPIILPDEWPPNALIEGLVIVPPHWDSQYASPTLSIAVPVLSYNNLLMGAPCVHLPLSARHHRSPPRRKSSIFDKQIIHLGCIGYTGLRMRRGIMWTRLRLLKMRPTAERGLPSDSFASGWR